MSNTLVGKLCTGGEERDAIHLAVAPVTAGQELQPGQHVGFIEGDIVGPLSGPSNIGIVDPFLTAPDKHGQKFMLCLYPGSVAGLRHDWSHPAFKGVSGSVAESEQWLRDYAVRYNPYFGSEEEAYQHLMTGLRTGEIIYQGVDMHSRRELREEGALVRHATAVMGRELNLDWFIFGCSC